MLSYLSQDEKAALCELLSIDPNAELDEIVAKYNLDKPSLIVSRPPGATEEALAWLLETNATIPMYPKTTTTIYLRNLDWDLLDRLAKQKPMDVAHMRERFRQQIKAVADAHNLPKLSAWATGLTNSALDYLTHMGFLESHFWEVMTGGISLKGCVAFIGPDDQGKEAKITSETTIATDGQHRVRVFTLKKEVEPHD